MSVRVQRGDFDVGAELDALTRGRHDVGGVSTFVGLVRKIGDGSADSSMTLEHYPGMTEKMLGDIETEAKARWPLAATLIIHRYGKLRPGDRIVLVAAASAHRKAAIDACEFLIDWLKTKAPFWKLEDAGDGGTWVDARTSDDAAAAQWDSVPAANGDKAAE